MLYSYFREEVFCISRKSLEAEDRVLAGVTFWGSVRFVCSVYIAFRLL